MTHPPGCSAIHTTTPSTAAYFTTDSDILGCNLIRTTANQWVWIWQDSCCQFWDRSSARSWWVTHLHACLHLYTPPLILIPIWTPSSTHTSLTLNSTDTPPHLHQHTPPLGMQFSETIRLNIHRRVSWLQTSESLWFSSILINMYQLCKVWDCFQVFNVFLCIHTPQLSFLLTPLLLFPFQVNFHAHELLLLWILFFSSDTTD